MRAQRDHDIDRCRDTPDLFVDRLKHRPHRRRARGIGDNEQHLATAELLLRHRLGHDLDRLLIGEQSALGYFFGKDPHGASDGLAEEPAVDHDVGAGHEARRLFAG